MSRYVNRTFKDETVLLDGNEFYNCRFERCRVQFGGELDGLAIVDCAFNGCEWEPIGAAAGTIQFLGALYAGFGSGNEQGRDLVESFFSVIRTTGRQLIHDWQVVRQREGATRERVVPAGTSSTSSLPATLK